MYHNPILRIPDTESFFKVKNNFSPSTEDMLIDLRERNTDPMGPNPQTFGVWDNALTS